MSYQPSSMVLFLTNCSLHKDAGGGEEYDESQAITSALPEALRDQLLERRASVFQLVKKNDPDFDWQGTPVSALEHNRALSSGRDLGGRHAAAYLPALGRYQGRFFQALGATGKRRPLESRHHTLFLSGLYGLLRPTEPVQLYSCPLAPQVAEQWRKDALLTDVLCEYIRRFGIARIIDLTAIDAYRQLIDWEKVAATNTDVLHCFDVMAAGESALTAFGRCMAEELIDLTEDELVGLPFEHRLGTVILRSLGQTVEGLPSEGANKAEPPDPSPAIKPAGDPPTSHPPWQPAHTKDFQKDMRTRMDMFTKVSRATLNICLDPMTPRGPIKPLVRSAGRWRYRLGDDRIVYWPDRPKRRVVFELFGPRGDVYDRLRHSRHPITSTECVLRRLAFLEHCSMIARMQLPRALEAACGTISASPPWPWWARASRPPRCAASGPCWRTIRVRCGTPRGWRRASPSMARRSRTTSI